MSTESCPKCGHTGFYHDYKTGVNKCSKCGHEWKKPTMKELMAGTVLDGALEATRVKPLTEFSEKPEAVVRVEEIPTFTPAFLSAVEQAWRSKSVQTYWDWICEPTSEGVSVTLRGTTKPHEFFPKDILERMKYDPVREHYYVPRTGPLGTPY